MTCGVCTSRPPHTFYSSRDSVEQWVKQCNMSGFYCDKHMISSGLQEIMETSDFETSSAVIKQKILILHSYLVISDHESLSTINNVQIKVGLAAKEETEREQKDDRNIKEEALAAEATLMHEILTEEEINHDNSGLQQQQQQQQQHHDTTNNTSLETSLIDNNNPPQQQQQSIVMNPEPAVAVVRPTTAVPYVSSKKKERNGQNSKANVLKRLMAADIVFQCSICNRKFAQINAGRAHVARNHKRPMGKQFMVALCNKCNFPCPTKKDQRKHMFDSHDQRMCECCSIPFTNFEDYWAHVNRNGGTVCQVCNKRFTTEFALKLHKTKQHKDLHLEGQAICPICGAKAFDIKQHVFLEHQLKDCPECGKQFTRTQLKIHLKKEHNKSKPVVKQQCQNCGKVVMNLKLHMEKVQCNIPEQDRNKALEHCDICDKQVRDLYHHKYQTHSEEVKCHLCDYKTSRKYNLKTHIQKVHEKVEQKKEFCTYCGKQVQNLNIHLQKFHYQYPAPGPAYVHQ